MSGLLGQAAPAGGAWQDLYTCPPNTVATLRVIVSNRVAVDGAFSVAASKNGDAVAPSHEIASNKPIASRDTGATIGFVISGGDVIRIFASNDNLSFTATGETRAE